MIMWSDGAIIECPYWLVVVKPVAGLLAFVQLSTVNGITVLHAVELVAQYDAISDYITAASDYLVHITHHPVDRQYSTVSVSIYIIYISSECCFLSIKRFECGYLDRRPQQHCDRRYCNRVSKTSPGPVTSHSSPPSPGEDE